MRSYELPLLVFAIAIPWAALRSRFFDSITESDEGATKFSPRARRCIPILLAVLAFPMLCLIADRTLERFPNSADEYSMLYEAETFAAGRLFNPPLGNDDFFFFKYIIEKDGKRCGMYPPAYPFVVSLFLRLGIPAWLVNPLLGALSVFVFFLLAEAVLNFHQAILATVALLTSSFFLFEGASFFSHQLCCLCILAATYCAHRSFKNSLTWNALLVGIFLGIAATTRYYTALLCALPIGVAFLFSAREQRWRRIVLAVLGGIPFVLLQLWYNHQITGNAFLFPHTWSNPEEKIGFYRGHTFLQGLRFLKQQLGELQEWTVSSALVLAVIGVATQWRRLRFYDWTFFALVAGYIFWWSEGVNRYGPRYYYEAFPLLLLTAVRLSYSLPSSFRGNRFSNFLRHYSRSVFEVGMAASLVYLSIHLREEHQIIEERTDLYTAVHEHQLTNSIVFIASTTGVLRPMPIQDLTRNGFDRRGSVLYAFDLGAENRRLMREYPDRKYFRYFRVPTEVHGTLQEIFPESSGQSSTS